MEWIQPTQWFLELFSAVGYDSQPAIPIAPRRRYQACAH